MKEVPITEVINHWFSQLEAKWAQISQNVTRQTRTELTKVIENIKGCLPNEPGIAFLMAYNNLSKFRSLIEGAEQGQYPLHTTVEMFSSYMRLGASLNDRCRGYETGHI